MEEGKVEEVQADKGRVEAELNVRVESKDKDLAAKDVEIAELKRRLFEAHDKNKSLEIDLEAERVKVETAEEAKKKAEEARDISTSALNVAQNNYAEAQTIVDTLVSESEWMRSRGVVVIANSILNATELDEAVSALIDASCAVGHRELVTDVLKHDDWSTRLKSIIDPPETVELTNEEEATGGDGDGGNEAGGDGGGNE
ncbi:hypothetical protein HanHA89_Chr17g0720261 [Helianthus annuus]|nr:hypothetical protein HanHA89_Chr17g0720261 [Helianthus annuus]